MRFFTPTLFFLAAAYVAWANAQGESRVIAFSFLGGLMPADAQDPASLGKVTVAILLGIGGLTLARAVVASRRRKDDT